MFHCTAEWLSGTAAAEGRNAVENVIDGSYMYAFHAWLALHNKDTMPRDPELAYYNKVRRHVLGRRRLHGGNDADYTPLAEPMQTQLLIRMRSPRRWGVFDRSKLHRNLGASGQQWGPTPRRSNATLPRLCRAGPTVHAHSSGADRRSMMAARMAPDPREVLLWATTSELHPTVPTAIRRHGSDRQELAASWQRERAARERAERERAELAVVIQAVVPGSVRAGQEMRVRTPAGIFAVRVPPPRLKG